MDVYNPTNNTLRIVKPDGRSYELSLDDDEFLTKYFKKVLSKPRFEVTILPLHRLRNVELEKITEIASLPEVYKFIGAGESWTEAKVQELADWSREDSSDPERRKYYSWAIILKEEDKPREIVGFIGIRPRDKRSDDKQLRYFVDPSRQRMGIASKAVMLAAKEYASEDRRNPSSLWAMVRKDNTPSIKLLLKLGFKPDGVQQIAGEEENVYRLDLRSYKQRR